MKVVDLQQIGREHGREAALRAIRASERVPPEEHDEECPVKQGASVDCVFPFVACVPDDFDPAASPHQEVKCPQCGAERAAVMVASGTTFVCGTWVRGGVVETFGVGCTERR